MEKASEWQTQQSSGTHTEFRQFSLVRKLAGMMLHLFLSGSEMRSAGCDGPNGMPFRLGGGLALRGPPNTNTPEQDASKPDVALRSMPMAEKQVPGFAGDTSNALFGALRIFPANVSKASLGTGKG